jgi:hypothetical protein
MSTIIEALDAYGQAVVSVRGVLVAQPGSLSNAQANHLVGPAREALVSQIVALVAERDRLREVYVAAEDLWQLGEMDELLDGTCPGADHLADVLFALRTHFNELVPLKSPEDS